MGMDGVVFDARHALADFFSNGCSHSCPLFRDGFQYAIVPGKWTRWNLSFKFRRDSGSAQKEIAAEIKIAIVMVHHF